MVGWTDGSVLLGDDSSTNYAEKKRTHQVITARIRRMGKVLFTPVYVCSHLGGTPSPSHNTSTGSMSFLEGTPSHNTPTDPMSFPRGYQWLVPGLFWGVPQSQAMGYPRQGVLGYPLVRTGLGYPPSWPGLRYLSPHPGQEWGTPPPPFVHAGGLSCFLYGYAYLSKTEVRRSPESMPVW